eukprot:4172011-Alexandrium_andersonii.AAC.1
MLQGHLPLGLDLPKQRLGIVDQGQILVGVNLTRGGLSSVHGVVADHCWGIGTLAVAEPKQRFTDAAELTSVVAGDFCT